MSASIYIIAGEASGDSHGAALMRSLRERDSEVKFYGAGGRKMAALAEDGFSNWTENAVIGVVDVLKNYGYFKSEFERMREEIAQLRPDAVVFVDYPGFNLRLAKRLWRDGSESKRIFYISPQVWAWNRGRIPKIAQYLDRMLCIFPFEKNLYESSGLSADFVGHPMLDSLAKAKIEVNRENNLCGLFPGSRLREVSKILPVMLDATSGLSGKFKELEFKIAAADEKLLPLMEALVKDKGLEDRCEIQVGGAYALMQSATAGLLASGTATLEAAFFGLPYVLVYKVSPATYWMAKWLIDVEFIGMVNILAKREVVKELVQDDACGELIAQELEEILQDESKRTRIANDFAEVIDSLGEGGASERAAEAILAEINT